MEEFVLTNDNYYSKEANEKYMSFHQYLSFAGHMGVVGCESKALAILKGEYEEETTNSMLIGSYVDSYFEGTLPQFRRQHPEIFLKDGETLKADFKHAEKMIKRCEEDELFMKYMSGEKQVIMTANWEGVDWKIKIDSYIEGKAIIDLKTSSKIHEMWRVADYGYVDFTEYWFYTGQLALYRKIVEICTGQKLKCYIAVVTKEKPEPDIELIYLDDTTLDNALNEIKMNLQSVKAVKDGEYEPTRCEKCDWCKKTKKLMKPINHYDLIEV